jgi:hypothetical protein
MGKYLSKFSSSIGTIRFASIAVSRKYVTPEQVQNAIAEQDEDCITGRPYRFLGAILLENHLITEEQMESILEEMNTI